jgi:hypothetical protein
MTGAQMQLFLARLDQTESFLSEIGDALVIIANQLTKQKHKNLKELLERGRMEPGTSKAKVNMPTGQSVAKNLESLNANMPDGQSVIDALGDYLKDHEEGIDDEEDIEGSN